MTSVRLLLRWWHLDARSWHLDALTNFVEVSHFYYYMLPCLNVCIDVYVTTTTCLPTCSCLPDYWLLCLPKTSSTPLIQWLRNSILLLSGSSMASTIFFKLNLFIFLLARRRSWNISQRILQQKIRLPKMIGRLVPVAWWCGYSAAYMRKSMLMSCLWKLSKRYMILWMRCIPTWRIFLVLQIYMRSYSHCNRMVVLYLTTIQSWMDSRWV